MRARSLLRAVLSAALVGGVLTGAPIPARAATTDSGPTGMDYRYVYIDTPDLHGRALSVSDDRTVVGFYYLQAAIEQPFVFDETHGTATLPLDSGMRHGGATTISRDGKTIAGWEETTTGDCWVVRWLKDTAGAWGVHQLVHHDASDVNFVGCAYLPVGIGLGGSIAITTSITNSAAMPPEGLLWTPSGVGTLTGQPRAVASTGEVVGAVPDGSTGTRPWREIGGALATPDSAATSAAVGLAEDGTIIVNSDLGAYRSGPEGYYVRQRDLPATGVAQASRARAISDHDETVGDSNVAAVSGGVLTHAVRWSDDGSVVDLNDVTPHYENETLLTATAVNSDGDIVGGAASDRTGGLEAPMLLVAMPPIVFVPGVAGSHLVDANGTEQWINCLGVHDDLALPPDGSTSIHADDVLRYDQCGPYGKLNNKDTEAYGPFIDFLKSRGLVEYDEAKTPARWTTAGCDTGQRGRHPNLFLFPYDWRQSNAVSAAQLADLMGCVRQFYTGPVVVVAHSMGGLVSRRYILDHPGVSNHVRDLVTIGTPWLGAPKLIRAAETGDFIPYLMTNGTVKKIIPTMPGPGQLLPSTSYYQLAPTPFTEDGWDINTDHVDPQQYTHDQVDALLDAQFANHAPITASANAFHAYTTPEGSQDDWRTDKTDVRYTVLYGVHKMTDTPGPVTAGTTLSCTVEPGYNRCTPVPAFKIKLVDGDGTVPLESSTRQGNGLDLNNHDHETLIPVYGSVYNDDTTEHTGLTRNDLVQQTVLKTDGRTVPTQPAPLAKPASLTRTALTATQPATPQQWNVDLTGFTGSTTVRAPDGTSDAVVNDSFRPRLPGVSHLAEGDHAELDVLPDGAGTYSVTFAAGSTPVQIDVRRGAQDSPSARSIWTDLAVPAGHVATLTITDSGPSLVYDADGDGLVETTAAPSDTLPGWELSDVTAPTVRVGSIMLNGSREYTLTATDDFSGVKSVMWSTDGHTFRDYDGPIALDPATPLTVFTEDYAGNRSTARTFDLHGVEVTPFTTATVVPQLSVGYSTTPVTVHLHARASDGTTVKSISWFISGQPTHVVDGDTATVQITDPGGFFYYYATDSAGTQEPTQYRFIGVDSTPPAVTFDSPTTGSVTVGLPSVAGHVTDTFGSGVASISFAVERNSDGAYWNGTDWQSGEDWLATKPGPEWWTGTWVADAPLPTGKNLTAGGYTVHARAVDRAGNAGTVLSAITVSTAAIIKPLQPPAGYTGYDTNGFGVNDSGQVAGMLDDGYTSHPPTRWDADGSAHLLPDGTGDYHFSWKTAWAVNDAGQVVGRMPTLPSGSGHAVIWNPDGTATNLTGDVAQAINQNGVAAGQDFDKWVIWTGGVERELPVPAGPSSDMEWTGTNKRKIGGINNAGTVVATRWLNQPGMGGQPVAAMAVQSNGVYTSSYLFPSADPTMAPPVSGALAINTQGDIVGWGGIDHAPGSAGYTASPPFLRRADGTVTWYDLGALQQPCGMAASVNDSDVVVGFGGQCPYGPYYSFAEHDATHRAWIIRDGVVQDLTALLPVDSGWVLNEAWSVSNTGMIAGTGTYQGKTRAFVMALGAIPANSHAPVASDVNVKTDPGAAVTVGLQATDADHDPLTWSVVNPSGHGTLSAISGGTVTYTPDAGFVGTDTFTARASDGTYQSNTATVTVTVGTPPAPPVPPTATLLAPTWAAEGTSFVVDGSDSAGPDGAGPLTYSWDLNDDGVFGDATTATATVTVPDDGDRVIHLRVTGAGGVDETSTTVHITNVGPVVTGLTGGSVTTGAPYTAHGTFTDPGADTWKGTVDYGDGGGSQPLPLTGKTFDLGHSYAKQGSYTVTVSVCDDDGGCGQQQARVDVTGGGVVTAQSVAVAATEGARFSGPVASFTYTDPGAGVAQFSASVDWGDGGAATAGTVTRGSDGTFSVTGAHTYADEGHYRVTVTIAAQGGTGATATGTATVADAPLTATGSATLTSVNPVSDLTVATFTDANPFGSAADFIASIDWGDGHTSAGTVTQTAAGAYAVRGAHTYGALGPRTVKVSVTDVGGSTAHATSQLVTYAVTPGGSFVIGDGNASVGGTVQFWGSQWWKANPLPETAADFTGFAPGVPPAACGGPWTSTPGASSNPPATLPDYVAVVVTDKVSRSGSTLSGTVAHVVVVKTGPGYAPDAGHHGTGTVVAVIC